MRMLIVIGLVAGIAVGSGCKVESKSKSEARARAAFQAGQQSGLQLSHGPPGIIIQGSVKNHQVPWIEGMTLSQAIVQAEYTGFLDPKVIVITRGGQRYGVDPKSLLRGHEDPALQPGDLIEIVAK